MRDMPFAKEWDKLKQPEFTTFRLERKDKDYAVGEIVRPILHARTKNRRVLGEARIVAKEDRRVVGSMFQAPLITLAEAMADGFSSGARMEAFLKKSHGNSIYLRPLHKLTLRWEYQEEPNASA